MAGNSGESNLLIYERKRCFELCQMQKCEDMMSVVRISVESETRAHGGHVSSLVEKLL